MKTYDSADVAEFIRRHGHPYDPDHDDYRRPPFAEPIKASKSSALYNAHSYHTKVPPEGIVPYLKHYTDPGDLVLDPFCGSGMTGVACLLTGRHAILNDLSPAAAHIAYNYCTPVDVDALKREFERIRAAVREEFEWLYGTTCDRCGGPATIQYTIWSDVFECARCGGEIVLWDVAVDPSSRKFSEVFSCPACKKEMKKLGLKRLPSVPVITDYECDRCSPHRGQHRTTERETKRINDISATALPYWAPLIEFDVRGPQYRRNALSSRKIKRVTDLYTSRNLWACARLWSEARSVQDGRIAAALEFGLTAINNYINTKQSYGGGGGGLSGSIYIPSFRMEKHVGLVFERKMANVIKYYANISTRSLCIAEVGSATDLGLVDADCVDYIFVDPPFGSNLYYSEVNLLWEAWLGEVTVQTNEAVVHRQQDGGTKRLPEYQQLMTEAFREMYRVLKPGRWASVVFHNSDNQIWQTILDAAEAAHFERAVVNVFDKTQLTFKGIRGAKGLERATNQDIVLNLLKPKPHPPARANGSRADGEVGDIEARIVEQVAAFLTTSPEAEKRTLQYLWNEVLYDMIRAGAVDASMAQVGEMLPYYFKQVDGRWYLRGEAVVGGNTLDLRTDAGAIGWLMAALSEPRTTGELIPEWQQLTAHVANAEAGRLDRLLTENFWQDKRTGHWRVPTPAERDKMSAKEDLAAQAWQRTIQRFLKGDLDRRPNPMELSAWVRLCYTHEFNREAVDLWPHLDESRLDPQEYRDLKRMVQACRIKLGAR